MLGIIQTYMNKPTLVLIWIVMVVAIFLFTVLHPSFRSVLSLGPLLMGVSMVGLGLVMWKQNKKSWQTYLIIGILLFVVALFGYI